MRLITGLGGVLTGCVMGCAVIGLITGLSGVVVGCVMG